MFRSCSPTFIEPGSIGRRKEIQMKGNSKKLAVLVIIAVLAVFTVVATATAQGQILVPPFESSVSYYVTGSGYCGSFAGPPPTPTNLLPPTSETIAVGPLSMYDGVYTFNRDGTFMATLNNRYISAGGATIGTIQYKGTYQLGKDGATLTFTINPPSIMKCLQGAGCPSTTYLSNAPASGSISPSGDTLEIHCGPPVFVTVCGDSKCTPADLTPYQVFCVITLEGFRCNGKCQVEAPE